MRDWKKGEEQITHHSPPQSLSVVGNSWVGILFRQVDEEGRENESKEAYVYGRYKFLKSDENIVSHAPNKDVILLAFRTLQS